MKRSAGKGKRKNAGGKKRKNVKGKRKNAGRERKSAKGKRRKSAGRERKSAEGKRRNVYNANVKRQSVAANQLKKKLAEGVLRRLRPKGDGKKSWLVFEHALNKKPPMQPLHALKWRQRRQSDRDKRKQISHSYDKHKRRLNEKRDLRKQGDDRKRRIWRLRGGNRLMKRKLRKEDKKKESRGWRRLIGSWQES